MAKQRINIVVPSEVLEALDALLERGERSAFFVEAAAERLELLQFQRLVQQASGAWADSVYGDLATPEDLAAALNDLRSRGGANGTSDGG